MEISPVFLSQLAQILPNSEINLFVESLHKAPPTSVRLNPDKNTPQFQDMQEVAWCKQGRYLPQRPIFTLDPNFWAGTYYVQEASSMFVGEVLSQILPQFTPNTSVPEPIKVLDLCAAPGGKSTHLSSIIGNKGLLVANEIIKTRVGTLLENLVRWGNDNFLVTNNDAKDFRSLESYFDAIIVDAPCSGEGMFRKEENALKEWNLENVNLCTVRQKRILTDIAQALKPNGYLIYSTCTYNRSENEENALWLLEQGFESIRLQLPEHSQVTEIQEKNLWAYRFFPHKTEGEGFFLTCLRKKTGVKFHKQKNHKKLPFDVLHKKQTPILKKFVSDVAMEFFEWNNHIFGVPNYILDDILYISKHLYIKNLGIELGTIKGQDFIPSHALAMSHYCPNDFQKVVLSQTEALQYLRKQDFEPQTSAKGWAIFEHNGHHLGWGKLLENRLNNYYPLELRVRM